MYSGKIGLFRAQHILLLVSIWFHDRINLTKIYGSTNHSIEITRNQFTSSLHWIWMMVRQMWPIKVNKNEFGLWVNVPYNIRLVWSVASNKIVPWISVLQCSYSNCTRFRKYLDICAMFPKQKNKNSTPLGTDTSTLLPINIIITKKLMGLHWQDQNLSSPCT